MAHIPRQEIERLQQEISLQCLVEAQGIELQRQGVEFLGSCPFHSDSELSLVVCPQSNEWRCRACQTGGSVIDWVRKCRGVSFRHAVEMLRNDHPALAAAAPVVSKGTASAVKLEMPFTPGSEDRQLLRQVSDHYHETLKESPEALKYLSGRGLQHPDMLAHFRLGFANRTLGYRLPDKNRKSGADIRGRLQRLGILRDSGHEHFSGSVVIPVLDLHGDVSQIYGRKITSGLRTGTPLHTYLPGPCRGVWNEEALLVSKEIILCQSLIDALTFWCAELRHVTASYGLDGFTDEHRSALKKHGTKKVLIAYNRSEAGDKACNAVAEELMNMGIDCYRVLFPRDTDVNQYSAGAKSAGRNLAALLHQAQWLGKGKAPTVTMLDKQSPNTPQHPPAVPVEKPRPLSIPEPVPVPAPAPHLSSACGIDIPAEINGDEITIRQGDRRYRIRGLARNTSHDALRVNVLVTRADAVHVDTINLYTSQQRALFSKQAADELKVDESLIKRDLGRLLLKLEELRDEQIRKALEPPKAVPLTPEETAAAMELLTDPRLLDRIVEDFDRCGVVGEQTNKLVGYIAAVSRRLEAPLAVVVQSSSAAGKSSLMEGVLAFIPEEDRVQYSAMTGQSLFYMGETDLKHKLLALVEEEGVSRAAYALKLLQSEGALTIASTGKDPGTGKLVTRQYRVEGPVMIFLTTTAIHLDEELLSRCLVLSVNEERPQTQAIHRLQREQQTLEGLLQKRERQEILCVHRNAQRLLRPLLVVNPYARDLTFLDHQTRTRRDHVKYLTLIRSIALLHQHQRPLQQTLDRGKPVQYIEVTLSDIATANRLVHEVLGRELDELPPQTRRLLLLIDQMTAGQCQQLKRERRDFRFTRRDVRSYTGWRDTQLRVHLQRLQDLEYLLVHRGGRGQSFVYELIFERGMQDDKPSLAGLIDPEKLARQVYDENKAESKGQFAEPMRGQNGGAAGSAPITPHSITTGLSNGLPVISAELPVFPGGHDKANVTTAMGDH